MEEVEGADEEEGASEASPAEEEQRAEAETASAHGRQQHEALAGNCASLSQRPAVVMADAPTPRQEV